MSFKSSVGSPYASPQTYFSSTATDLASLASGATETFTIVKPAVGTYVLSTSIYVTSQGGSFTDVDVSGESPVGTSFDIDKLTSTFTGIRTSGATIILCNGIDDLTVSVTATVGAGTWTLKEGSYVEIVRIN